MGRLNRGLDHGLVRLRGCATHRAAPGFGATVRYPRSGYAPQSGADPRPRSHAQACSGDICSRSVSTLRYASRPGTLSLDPVDVDNGTGS